MTIESMTLQTKSSESPLIKKSFFAKNKYALIAFTVPFVLMIFAFYMEKLYPFGDNQVLVIDMWHQYFQFFKDLQNKLQTGGSLLYTWHGGAGTNFIAQIAYYASSPLYLLSIFVPAKFLTELMAFTIILKISFASMFMYIFLRGMYKKEGIMTVVFSVFYGLCAYSMGYYWCLMWLDCVALLPLCILGLNRLIDEGKFKMYTISLGLIMFTNYYIGVMVCMFIAVYYPILYFSRTQAKGAKVCFITTIKAIGFSALGACLAAIILIPTYQSMQNTYYMGSDFPATSSLYNPILDVVNNLLPGVKLTVRGGLPNIYCGLLSLILGILYFFCKTIPAKQKILNCLILAFLIVSFNWNKLDFIWHGLHFPNELPYRYSFAFSFLLVNMAAQAFFKIKDITPGQIGIVGGAGFIYLILMQKLDSEIFTDSMVYYCLLLLGLYCIGLAIVKSHKTTELASGLFIFLIMFGEMASYAANSVKAVGHSGRTTYYESYNDLRNLIEKVEKEDKSFYRMELASNWTTNDAPLYGYNGISQFSSTINSNVTRIMKAIGLAADPASNRYGYFMSSPVLNSMLNVKYVMGKSKSVQDEALTLKYTSNGSTIYRNKYDLSIAYMVYDDIYDWSSDNFSNPLEYQNQYVWKATGVSTPVLNPIDDTPELSGDNVEFGEYLMGEVSATNTSGNSNVRLIYTSDKDQPIYAFVEASGASSITGKVENGNPVSFESNRGAVIALGSVRKGETVAINIAYDEGQAGSITSYVYGLDQETWDRAYTELSDEMLQVTQHSDTKIKGKVTVKNDGVLMTSIPYEKGWSAKVNGKKQEMKNIQNGFCAIELKEGTYEIEFNYIPAGLIAGVLITFVSIGLLIVLHYTLKKQERQKILIAQTLNEFNAMSSVSEENQEELKDLEDLNEISVQTLNLETQELEFNDNSDSNTKIEEEIEYTPNGDIII